MIHAYMYMHGVLRTNLVVVGDTMVVFARLSHGRTFNVVRAAVQQQGEVSYSGVVFFEVPVVMPIRKNVVLRVLQSFNVLQHTSQYNVTLRIKHVRLFEFFLSCC